MDDHDSAVKLDPVSALRVFDGMHFAFLSLRHSKKEDLKMGKVTVRVIAPILLVLGATSFSSATEVSPDKPEVQTYHGISFVSGGFGLEERAALRRMGSQDNLELSFALRNDEYLGGAKVLIKDERGNKILETESDGPLFYAKLPEGKYVVMATARGRTLTQVAEIPSKGQKRLFFAWKMEAGNTRTLASRSR